MRRTMKVLTLDEAAGILRCTQSELLSEIDSGRLASFTVAGQRRVLESELHRFANYMPPTASACDAVAIAGGPLRLEISEMEPFSYTWPTGEVNRYEETRPLAVTVYWGDKKAHFVIGRGHPENPQLGRRRWRYNLFLSPSPGSPQGLISILDFVAGNEFEADGLMVGLIKLPSGKFLREDEPIPPEYRGFHLARFNEIVRGPHAWSRMAVIAHKEDLETMIRHGLIRAVQRGSLRW
jgi:hypothetical protein